MYIVYILDLFCICCVIFTCVAEFLPPPHSPTSAATNDYVYFDMRVGCTTLLWATSPPPPFSQRIRLNNKLPTREVRPGHTAGVLLFPTLHDGGSDLSKRTATI